MSLWGAEFDLQETKKETKKLLKKVEKPKEASLVVSKTVKSKKVNIEDKLALIYAEVRRILGVYAEKTVVLRSREELHDYIDKAIENNVIAIDTETNNSLDPITCKLMGPCIYTPGQKNAYIPVNHIDIKTGELLPNQVTENDVYEEFQRLKETQIITHNGKFDYEVLKCTTGYEMPIYWDTYIGARILNENERAGLKQQYIEKIDPSIEKYDIEHLFSGVEYAQVDPEIFALYAATDAYMTYRLYKEYQLPIFMQEDSKKLYYVFRNIEMPLVEVLAEMELAGVCLDLDYAQRLSLHYHKLLDEKDREIEIDLKKYEDKIASWRLTKEANEHSTNKRGNSTSIGKSKNEQLENPVNLSSPTQLAIFIYDILKKPVVDEKSPRGTGEDIIAKFEDNIFQLILDRRGLLKLINTYVDALPQAVNKDTGRIYAHFLQIGADTGRLSSQSPNLQNVPSHKKDIRLLFKAAPGNVIVGGDFSLQKVG